MVRQSKKVIITLLRIIFAVFCLWASAICILPFLIYGSRDSFYRHGDDMFDVDLNFPLIKPYYAQGFPKGFPLHNDFREYDWYINLVGGKNSNVGWYNVRGICCGVKIAVQNGIILVYAPDQRPDTPGDDQKRFYWFALNPGDQSEFGFEKQSEFEDYLARNRLKKPVWLDPNHLHDEFNRTGCLVWFPDCNRIPPLFRFPPGLFENN